MNYLLILLVSALAGARMWRLLAIDDAGDPARVLVWNITNRLRGAPNPHKRTQRSRIADSIWEGWTCPYCLGFWLTSAFVGSGLLWADTWGWQLVAGCFAAAYVASSLGAWLDKKPITDSGGEITPEGVEAPDDEK